MVVVVVVVVVIIIIIIRQVRRTEGVGTRHDTREVPRC